MESGAVARCASHRCQASEAGEAGGMGKEEAESWGSEESM